MRLSRIVEVSICRARATIAGIASVAFLLGAVSTASANPIVVTPGTTFPSPNILAETMVASLIGANPGITVVGTPTYTGALGAAGLFSGGAGVLPFEAGILLTTGSASLVPGPNSGPFSGIDNGEPGDPVLEAIGGAPTFDASLLSFSFIPVGDSISFQYIFGSDEYTEFIGVNDNFAFHLNGTNIALIPGTTTPVSINNVNDSVNPDYFTNNNGGSLNIEYDGLAGAAFLFSLYASGAVVPGSVNTITLGIADSFDGFIDSGVMLAAGTFSTPIPTPTPTPVPEPGSAMLFGGGILALGARTRLMRSLRLRRAVVPSRE